MILTGMPESLPPANKVLGQGNIFSSVCQGFCQRGGGCVCSRGGGLLPGRWPAPGGGGIVERTPLDGYCCERYASYWNAFLL